MVLALLSASAAAATAQEAPPPVRLDGQESSTFGESELTPVETDGPARAGEPETLPGLPVLPPAVVEEPAVDPRIARLPRSVVRPGDDLRSDRARRAAETDPFGPLGVDIGAFMAWPSLEIGGAFTDNVRQSPTDQKADFGLELGPELRIESDWVRHSLTFRGEGDLVFYEQESDFDTVTAAAESTLRLDVRRSTDLETTARFVLTSSGPDTNEVPETAAGNRQDVEYGISSTLNHAAGLVSLRGGAGATWFRYGDVNLDDGATEANRDRDYVEPALALRAGYRSTSLLEPFVEIAYAPRIHSEKVDRSGLRRNSQGYALRTGFAIEDGDVWRGEVGLRYDRRIYDDPLLGPIAVLGLDANLAWRPTRITQVTFTASSGIAETSVDGESGAKTWSFRLEGRQEMGDRLAATAGVGVDITDYTDDLLDETAWTADLELTYAVRRGIDLVAGYEFTLQTAADPEDGYEENRFRLGARFRF